MAAIPTTHGLLRVVSNAVLTEKEREAALKRAEDTNNKRYISSLANYVRNCWQEARRAKEHINERLYKAQRARMGVYDPKKKQQIAEFGGSDEYARLTDNKCRVAEAWLRDVYFGQTERPWSIKPTPMPDMPQQVMESIRQAVGTQVAQLYATTGQMPDPTQVYAATKQMKEAEQQKLDQNARDTAMRMEKLIDDQLTEGNWHREFSLFISDLVPYPAAHFKAPFLRKKSRLQWQQGDNGWQPTVGDSVIPVFERVDPYRIFPAPGVTDPQDGFMIEWLSYSRDDIYNLIGVPGFSEDAIRAVLDEYGKGGLTDWLGIATSMVERNGITGEDQNLSTNSVTIDCLEFHGPCRGKDLIEWGYPKDQIADPDKDYEANVWLIGTWVIKAQLNPNPLSRRPYRKASIEDVPGSYWGVGLVDMLDDVQGVANAAMRSLVNNLGMASGPQVAVNVDRLPAGEDLTQMYPWKIWQIQDAYNGSNAPAIDFFQPQSNAAELINVIDKFYALADDISLLPRYMSGNTDIPGGVGRTASGVSMVMNAANKGMKSIVSNIDLNVLTPMLEDLYNHNMQYSDDETVKGDCQIVARGAISLMQLESLQLRRNEFLQATANPLDSQIIGPQGRTAILREVAKGLEMDINEIIPSPQAAQQAMQENAQAMPQQGGTPPAPNREQLATGQATTDIFSPNPMS